MYRIGMILGPAMFMAAILEWILRLTHYVELLEKSLPWTEHMTSPIGIWITMMVGIIIFLAAWAEYEKEKKEEEKPKQPAGTAPSSPSVVSNPIQTVSPTITVNPTIDASQHHHYPAPPALAETKTPAPTPKHNVVFVSRKVANIVPVEDQTTYFVFPSDDIESPMVLKAFIANFRNDRIPGIKVPDWDYVYAQIIYRNKYGGEIESVGSASWVGTPKKHTNFEGAYIRSVIIALQRGDGTWVAASPEETKVPGRYNLVTRDLNLIDLSSEIASADVILHDSKGQSLAPKRFLLDLQLGMLGEG